mmetsp:Transcript_11258/g.21299  ORF Transcript_11258/g.21299 Transcript_11258/m.21299 type:complete len:409 (-) Transcript_11258:341-1567(-)
MKKLALHYNVLPQLRHLHRLIQPGPQSHGGARSVEEDVLELLSCQRNRRASVHALLFPCRMVRLVRAHVPALLRRSALPLLPILHPLSCFPRELRRHQTLANSGCGGGLIDLLFGGGQPGLGTYPFDGSAQRTPPLGQHRRRCLWQLFGLAASNPLCNRGRVVALFRNSVSLHALATCKQSRLEGGRNRVRDNAGRVQLQGRDASDAQFMGQLLDVVNLLVSAIASVYASLILHQRCQGGRFASRSSAHIQHCGPWWRRESVRGHDAGEVLQNELAFEEPFARWHIENPTHHLEGHPVLSVKEQMPGDARFCPADVKIHAAFRHRGRFVLRPQSGASGHPARRAPERLHRHRNANFVSNLHFGAASEDSGDEYLSSAKNSLATSPVHNHLPPTCWGIVYYILRLAINN